MRKKKTNKKETKKKNKHHISTSMSISELPRNLFCYLVVQTRLLIGGRGGGGLPPPL